MDVRRARKGDCLLLHFGTKAKPGLVMIDGGPRRVYEPFLKPRIDQIRAARKLTKNDSLVVDLLMVSHVDDDHIQGILELTGAEIVEKNAHRPRLLNVQSFWHNSFDELIGHEPKELTASFSGHFGQAATSGGGSLPEDKKIEVVEQTAEDDLEAVESSLKVLASIEQGFRLRQDAEGLGFPRNPEFGGKLIIAKARGKPVPIGQGLKLTVVGPMQPEIAALFKKHQKWLEDLKKKGKSPPEALAAYVDKSVPNLSSIVALAEVDGKRMLLTGDARGDKVLKGLQLVGLLGAGNKSKMEVDLLKVPHHGSANNLDDDFFERIVARHYVFSGDGEHGNPERESLEMLLAARGDDDYEVHLTYPVDELDVARKKDWEETRKREIARKAKHPNTEVREKWSGAKHSLGAFLKANPEFKDKIRIAGDAHVVDLGDPLGRAWPTLA
jgi:hypothetical protein